MKLFLLSFVLLLFLVKEIVSAPITVLPPTEDPFYKADEGFENEALGTVLRWRKTPYKLRSLYFPIDVQNSWDILVRSEDPNGEPIAVVSTIIEPYNADPTKLVAYNIAQDSSSFDCSSTFAIDQGAPIFGNLEVQFEFSFMGGAAVLSQGYYIVTTNYKTTTNYTSAFTAGRLAGHNILNSLRGTLSTGNFTGLDNPDIVLWGYSGGALASGWTAALMSEYAPELEKNVIGAALGGLPANITETLIAVDGGFFAGLIATGINGLANQYPVLTDIIKENIRPTKYDYFLIGGQECLVNAVVDFADASFLKGNDSFFTTGAGILAIPEVNEVILDNTLAIHNKSEVPTVPIFLYHGTWDQIVPYTNSEYSYTNWCAAGAPSIEFASDLTGGHITDILVGLPAAAKWIQNMFNGVAPVQGCKETNYLSLLEYPGAIPELVDVAKNFMAELLDEKIGPASKNITKRDLVDYREQGLLSDDILARKLYKNLQNKKF